MKKIELTAFGLEGLRVAEADVPQPGAGEVLVKVEALSLNYLDVLVIEGHYNAGLPLPHTPGSDAAGTVVEVGTSVRGLRVGDRVVTQFIRDWTDGELTLETRATKLGAEVAGVFAEYLVLPAHAVVPVPRTLSTTQAATLPVAALVAWTALVEQGQLRAGQTVLIQGTGGVSLFALQFARAAGARTIVTHGAQVNPAALRQLGADYLIDFTRVAAWDAEVRRLTDGRGVDAVLEIGGKATFNQSLAALRLGGYVGVVGFVTGPELETNVFNLIQARARVQGNDVGSRASFERMNHAIEVAGLQPVIDRSFPFVELPAALRHLKAGGHFGKIVVTL